MIDGRRSSKGIYYHLYVAQLLALVSTGVATVALALLAYDLAGADAGAVLGTALAIKMLTYVVVAPVVAAFTGHLPRRALLVSLDLVRAAIVLLLPFVTEVWQIYALIFVFQAAFRRLHAHLPGDHPRSPAGRAGLHQGAGPLSSRP
jgi:MFS family permease